MKRTRRGENGAGRADSGLPLKMTLGAQVKMDDDPDLIAHFLPLTGNDRSEEIRRVLRAGLGLPDPGDAAHGAEVEALRQQVETMAAALAALPGKLSAMQQPDGELWTELRALEGWRGYFDRALAEIVAQIGQLQTTGQIAPVEPVAEAADDESLKRRRGRLKSQDW